MVARKKKKLREEQKKQWWEEPIKIKNNGRTSLCQKDNVIINLKFLYWISSRDKIKS